MKTPLPIQWVSYEYEYREKSTDWFWAVGIITLAISVTSIIFHNLLFAIVILIGGFSLSLFATRPPKGYDTIVGDEGVQIGELLYPYRLLESFWIENDTTPRLFLKSKKLVLPFIIITIDSEVNLLELHETLSQHIPEVFHSESPLEKFFERLGF